MLYRQKQEILSQQLSLKENISKRKKVEEALRLLNSELEERIAQAIEKHREQQHLLVQKSKLESLGKIAAGMAHEINQPLATISMGLDNILYEQQNGKLKAKYLTDKINTLFGEISKIKQLIEHVRVFSRDQKTAKLEKVNISDAVRDAVSMIVPQFEQQGINLTLNLIISGNKYKIEQIILNLLSNARDAVNDRQNKADSNDYQKTIVITTTCGKNYSILEVSDNGIGIPAPNLDNIFDPFFTTKSYDKGTGMGLSIVFGIVNELNGEIKVDSKEYEYTKISVNIPAYR